MRNGGCLGGGVAVAPLSYALGKRLRIGGERGFGEFFSFDPRWVPSFFHALAVCSSGGPKTALEDLGGLEVVLASKN